MITQLVCSTPHSDNGSNLSSSICGTGCLSKVTSSKLIQPVLIQLVGRTLHSDNGVTGHLSKVTISRLKKLIRHVFTQLVGRTLRLDNGCTVC